MATLSDIEAKLNAVIPKIVKHVADESVDEIQEHIDKYYYEWSPDSGVRGRYQRTGAFRKNTLSNGAKVGSSVAVITLSPSSYDMMGSSSEEILSHNLAGHHGGEHFGKDVWEDSLRGIDAHLSIWTADVLNEEGIPYRNKY